MRSRPIHHLTALINAAIIDTASQRVRDRVRERRSGGDGQRLVAPDRPRGPKVIVVRRAVVRFTLRVVRRAEILVLEGAGRWPIDVDAAVHAVCDSSRVTIETPFRETVAGIVRGVGRVLVGDCDTVRQKGAILETILEVVGVRIVVTWRGCDVQIAPDIVRVSVVIVVLGVVTGIVGLLVT